MHRQPIDSTPISGAKGLAEALPARQVNGPPTNASPSTLAVPNGTAASSGALAPLLVDAREATRLLAISARTLWELTQRGEIPAVRIGRAVRYDPADLAAYVQSRKRHGPAQQNGRPV